MLQHFLELGNRYAAKSDWTDFALTKFCLCAMGVLLGLAVPAKSKKAAAVVAGCVFAAAYLPLMKRVFDTVKEMRRP